MSQYVYTKSPVALDSLEAQIAASSIVTAVDMNVTNVFGDQLTLGFKADLSDPDKTTLDALVAAHDGIPLTQPAQPVTISNAPTVTTQFEIRDKTIKLACLFGAVQEDGTVTAYLKVPGTPNPTGDNTLAGRWISSGTAFFDIATPGDIVTAVKFVDHDNILGYGVDFQVGSYTDDDAEVANQGWFIPPKRGEIKAEAIGGYGFAPAGFYIMVTGKKGGGLTTGTLYVNFEWGKKE